jgi:hypothetical protein
VSKLRAVNGVLRKVTGYELTRPQKPGFRGQGPSVAPRPPAEPGDRLLVRPVFVIAPVRSGSTLLRVLLNGHSKLHAPHELHVHRLRVEAETQLALEAMEVLGHNVADLEHLLWDRVLHRELVRSGKEVVVEKTPGLAFKAERIATCWPDARFVFLLRNPAAIAYSWYDAEPGRRTLAGSAEHTVKFMEAVEAARQALPGHTVRYEELTADPGAALKDLCAFLEVDFEPAMVDYKPPADDLRRGLGDWRGKIRSGRVQSARELPADLAVPAVLGPICAAWGYPGPVAPTAE